MSHMDDAAIQEVASSFPYLQTIGLGTRYCWTEPLKITLNGLIALLAHCSHLREVSLAMDATILDPITFQKPGGGVVNTAITVLSVGCSSIDDPTGVAVVLSAVLPSLKKVTVEAAIHAGPDRDARKEKWEDVIERLGSLAMVRGQERQQAVLEFRSQQQ
ncbi:hypothetical protein BV22DRAFT_1029051 [Leucogyrophana mollusca]|uniref:Uncharacterized protein n=1 Tax=Leucogyrophana mollusca TaxID=85980 RepID=A0ACB8BVY2_9AGAM|nr:hypothetical protein BV22DRAFT_1029051 [Leucogyrophana mollusca]